MSRSATANHLRDMFVAQQARMRAELEEVLAAHRHPGAIGDGSEEGWLAMLRAHLPSRYQAQKGFVIDADGRRSDQIDVVIHDRQYSPCLSTNRGGHYVPAESVYAVLEVKQALNRGHVEYAGNKIASVRRLRRTSAAFAHLGGRAPADRPVPRILGGLVTLDSDWSPSFGPAFRTALAAAPDEQRVDIGCVLDAGSFEVEYDTEGPTVTTSGAAISLSAFFFRLLHRLQQVGTVPAIDYDAYTRGLGESFGPDAGT